MAQVKVVWETAKWLRSAYFYVEKDVEKEDLF